MTLDTVRHRLRSIASVASIGSATLLVLCSPAAAQEGLLLNQEFGVFTSENAAGYMKPLFTSFQEGLATNLYHGAVNNDKWGIGIDVSIMGLLIPESHRSYDAALPECYADSTKARTAEYRDGRVVTNVSGSVRRPTVFGDRQSNPVYAVPQNEANEHCTTVGFAEGNDISLMSGLPNIQLLINAPSRTEVRARLYPVPDGDRSLLYFGLAVSQQVDPFFDLFSDSLMGLAVNASYHSLSWTNILSASGMTAGVHFSKAWNSGVGVYAGAQVETFSGTFTAHRKPAEGGDASTSPYEEVREGRPISFDVESFNSFRALVGVSFKSGIVDLHADAALAQQPVFSAGMAIRFASF